MSDNVLSFDEFINYKYPADLQINEDKEAVAEKTVIDYIENNGYDRVDARKKFKEIREIIPNIGLPVYQNSNGREKRTYKYGIGVARLYLNGELDDEKDKGKMNMYLDFLDKKNDNFFDGNFKNWSFKKIDDRLKFQKDDDTEDEKRKSLSREFTGKSDYKIVPIPDYKEAEKYKEFNDWCISQKERHFDTYTRTGVMFYFCLKDGFENTKRVQGKNAPFDEYGLSMIAVCVNPDGSPRSITTRWNDNELLKTDKQLTSVELEDIINMSFYKTFLPDKDGEKKRLEAEREEEHRRMGRELWS